MEPARKAGRRRAPCAPTPAASPKAPVVLAGALAALLALGPPPAAGSPGEGPTIAGWGRLSEDGARLTLRISASSPAGWDALHLLTAALPADREGGELISFDIEDDLLTVSGRPVVVGTGATVAGRWLRVSAADVVVTTGGARIEFTLRARVVGPLQGGEPLALGAEDDLGRRASAERRLAVAHASAPPVGWATVTGVALGALLVGLLLGGAISARRHPRRISIYAAVQRRIERERAGQGRPGGAR